VLYGRSRELDEIDRLLSAARDGHGGALLISGEPGLGKTALLEAALERAEGMAVTSAEGAEAETHLPFAALGEIAEPLIDGVGELPSPQASAIGAALALVDPGSVPGDRLAVFAGFLGLVRREASQGPVLIVVDDAQWLDRASAECLGYAARRLENSAVALIAAARTGEGRQPLDGRIAQELRLSGLNRDDALALLQSSSERLAGPAAEVVVEVAVGNPLALLELPRLLTDEQRRGVAPVDPILAPRGVLWEAFERRLAGLTAPGRTALVTAAASIDRSLAPVIGACRELGLEDSALEEGEVKGLITVADDRVVFSHPLLRGVTYHGATAAERRVAHRALAAQATGDAQAWHLAAASLGPDAESAAALEQAGQRATARAAHSAAADAFERAAELSEGDEARSRRLFAAGFAAGLGGAYPRSAALLDRAAEIDDPGARADVRHLLAMVTLVGGIRNAFDNHRMLSEEAERITSIDRAMAAMLHADAGVSAVVAGDCRLALSSAEQAAAILPTDAGEGVSCQVHAMLGMGLALAGRTAEARSALDQAGELLPQVPPISPAAGSIAFSLGARLCTGEEALLRDELRSLIAAAHETGTRGLLPYDQLLAADVAYRLGDWDAADRHSDEAVTVAEDSGQGGPLSIALVVRARLRAALGAADEARADAERGIELAEPPGYGSTVIWGRSALGFLELTNGRPDEAIAELEMAEQLSALAGLEDPVIVPWASDLVESYAQAGRADDAARAAAALSRRAERNATRPALALAARAEALADPDAVDSPFEAAIEHHEAAGLPFELARTLLAFGARLHRDRRRAEARTRLRSALDILERLGADPWSERARAELRAAGAIERAPASDPDELTPQEARVARAVARGSTNREVAAELFLSPKTIEFHLGRVYRKLGIHSRTELATLVAEDRLEPAAPPDR
jgi:DNA-binding CsgD family transcriptional regulator